jgi:hypothetical protein
VTTLEAVQRGYVECAFWSSHDDDGTPFERTDHELSEEADASMRADCADFLELLERENVNWSAVWGDEQLGHDFWLTRNGHGAGFWDRFWDCPEAEMGDRLTAIAKTYGESSLYVGDDGRLYCS